MSCLQLYVIGTPLACLDTNIHIKVLEWKKLMKG